jgi:MFS family permease
VLRHREFRLLFAGQAFSVLGDRIVMIALPFAVLSLPGGSAGDVGLVMGANVLAFGLFVLVGGVVADRLPRQRTMLASDVVRAVVQAVGALLLLTDRATVASLVVIGLLYGAAEAFFRPAVLGLVPQLVQRGEEQAANALLTLSMNVSMVFGPALAGVLVALTSPGVVVAVDAGTFVVSGLTLLRLRPRAVVPATGAGFREQLVGGWREVRTRAWVVGTLGLFSAYHALVIPAIYVLGPAYAQDERGGASAWGLISAGFGAGAVVGSLLALRWRPHRPGVAIGATILLAGCQAVIVVSPVPTLVVAALEALTGVCVALGFTLWETALQQHIPAEAQSRVSSFDHLVSVALMPVGYAALGPVAETLGVGRTATLCTLVTVAVGALVLSLPAQRRLSAVPPPGSGERDEVDQLV